MLQCPNISESYDYLPSMKMSCKASAPMHSRAQISVSVRGDPRTSNTSDKETVMLSPGMLSFSHLKQQNNNHNVVLMIKDIKLNLLTRPVTGTR